MSVLSHLAENGKGRTMAEQTAMHSPCWTELAVPDVEAATVFYKAVFGWDANTEPDPEARGYTMFQLNGAAVAAVMPPMNPTQPMAWTVCLAVEDAEATAAKAAEHGGRALMPPADVFGLGRYGVLADPAGAAFSIWQAKAFSGADILGDPNSLGWIELATRDVKRALDFYPAVFGWSAHPGDGYTEWGIGETRFGGLFDLAAMPGPGADAPAHWKPYFRVANVDETTADATGAGGAVLMPPCNVPGDDIRIAVLKDPQGAAFGVFTPAG